ncbi:MAG: membrane protein associated [Beijerinckiaceae bacterium]|nr:MAG: membrane protein associated [Beijerinckiaceae bacterium]
MPPPLAPLQRPLRAVAVRSAGVKGAPGAGVAVSGLSIALAFATLLLAAWAFGATYLLLSGNRLAANAVNRTFQLQDYYEHQGAEFRRVLDTSKAEAERARRDLARIEQIANERVGVESKLVELVRRQTQVESRQSALVRITEQLNGAPISALQAGTAAAGLIPPRRAPRALESTRSVLGLPAEGDADVELDPDAELLRDTTMDEATDSGDAHFGDTRAVRKASSKAPKRIAPVVPAAPPAPLPEGRALEIADTLLQRLRQLESNQLREAQALGTAMQTKAGLLKQAAEAAGRDLADIVEPSRMKAVRAVAAIARTSAEDGSPYGVAITTIRQNASVIRRYLPVVSGLPLRQPVDAASRISSRFGTRSDPFLGTARFHAGQDFAAAIGTPVYSTGSGVVQSAGNAGGYGNLVQVSHGNGLVTRYAHLSEISVSVGQPVAAGQPVGKAGSTGRSTGPHLHYETRLNNVPNDPMRLLKVGAQLGVVPGANAALIIQTK